MQYSYWKSWDLNGFSIKYLIDLHKYKLASQQRDFKKINDEAQLPSFFFAATQKTADFIFEDVNIVNKRIASERKNQIEYCSV